ncbi:hypothetical protein [Thermoplasma sp. Kam2015]|nr:hypothetical protein [Thermoplasma sp. Kam2015]
MAYDISRRDGFIILTRSKKCVVVSKVSADDRKKISVKYLTYSSR